MKLVNFLKKAVCFSILIIAVFFSGFSVFAVNETDNDFTMAEPVETEPVYTEPVVTDAPYQEETTEYVPETEPLPQETTEYVPTETEPYEPETEAPTQAQYVEPQQQSTTSYIQTPTVSKTVSKKQYSTNYTAGIISWACVGVGVIVAAAVLISTKVSGRKAVGR
ncbi:hypothetical protein [Ruminococcus sp.]|uniref:hypothetical protein n=1 Tax=Ruminococcus sp. TaxID=41978 RepID=UPI0025CF4667|nr:hypothetical protein [Ruminococcus sp.]MCI6616556.1 hypothetical protein [Ruminococcus sp.]